MKERALFNSGSNTTRTIATDARAAAVISLVLLLPLLTLESLHTTVTKQNAHGLALLFSLLWLLPFGFLVLLLPVVRNTGRLNLLVASRVSLLLSLACAIVFVLLWAGLLMDQLPCFLGVPNCD